MTTFTLFFAGELYAYFLSPEKRDKGVFVQGVFRSNMAIMGLATVANAYGDKGVSVGAVYMGIITIVYNILSVITLSRSDAPKGGFWHQVLSITKKIGQNPLIIALVAAFVYKFSGLAMPPQVIVKTGELLAAGCFTIGTYLCGGNVGP